MPEQRSGPRPERAPVSTPHPSPQQQRLRELLTRNSFLGRLPSDVLDVLIRKGRVKRVARGEVIYRRGDPGDSMMVLMSGKAKIANVSASAREIVLHFLGKGDIFGEIAALDGKERAAHVVALEDLEIFVLYTRDLLPVLMRHPRAMMEIVRALCEKARLGAAIIEDNTLEMRGRMARGLLRLAHYHGRTQEGGVSLELTISQAELGKYLDLSRANVSRQLGLLKSTRIITVAGTQITICDPDALAAIGDSGEEG
jgi:CRP/FNR family cyclic AMP-dependent transcriptional regulator